MAVSGYISLRTQYVGPSVANTAGVVADALDITTTIVYGTNPNGAIDTVFSHTNASLSTGGETLILTALVAPSGTLSIGHLREVTIINTGSQAITVGSATNPFVGYWGTTLSVKAGGMATFVDPLSTGTAITASTNDGVKLVSASGTAAYKIIIKGTVA